uniref:Uncharacterized protein n=1 Tax=Cucumis melo TaxID=3656 RepID=A0A9I9CUF6_CUCME
MFKERKLGWGCSATFEDGDINGSSDRRRSGRGDGNGDRDV